MRTRFGRRHDASRAFSLPPTLAKVGPGLEPLGRKMLDDVEKADDARAKRQALENGRGGFVLRRKEVSFDSGRPQALQGDLRRVHPGDRRDPGRPACVQEPSPPGAVIEKAGEIPDVLSDETDQQPGLPDSGRPKSLEKCPVVVLLVIVVPRGRSRFRDSPAGDRRPGIGRRGGCSAPHFG
jgi:hypothetical protein